MGGADWRHLVKAMEVTRDLVESNGSAYRRVYRMIHFTSPTGWLPVHCCPMLSNEFGKTLPFLLQALT